MNALLDCCIDASRRGPTRPPLVTRSRYAARVVAKLGRRHERAE